MNKINKNISYFILFCAFILFTRYVQLIKDHHFSQNISLIGSKIFKDPKCYPEAESILGKINKNNTKTLLIVLDGYPTKTNYKRYIGKDSVLHDYLETISDQNINAKTVIQNTSYSLAYLLGNITPSNGCTYPSFQGNYDTYFIAANTYFSNPGSICRDDIKYKMRYKPPLLSIIGRLINISNKTNYNPGEISNKYSCSLDNPSIGSKLANHIKKNQELKDKKLLIIHEVKWHDYPKLNELQKYDLNYKESILNIYNSLYNLSILDEILIISDHGTANMPLTKNGQERKNVQFGSKPVKTLDFVDEDLFSVFMYRVEMNDKRKSISNLDKNYIFGTSSDEYIYLMNAQARIKKESK